MQPFNSFGNPKEAPDHSSVGEFDREAPNPDAIRPLDQPQLRIFEELMGKNVVIRTKIGSYANSVKVSKVIESFLNAYASLCSLLTKSLGSEYITDRSITVIRGSTNFSLLNKTVSASDIDILNKFETPPPLPFTYLHEEQRTHFREFCSMLGLEALKILDPKLTYTISSNGGRLSCAPIEEALRLIDKTKGVFIKFLPLEGQAGCIYSMGSLDEATSATSVEIDLTFQFGPPRTNLRRIFSPLSPSPALSSERATSCLQLNWGSSTPTFTHDAIEVVIPTKHGLINRLTTPYFQTLFGLSIQRVETLLAERTLQILNTDMFQGYRRLFYEITRGRIPLTDPRHPDSEASKIIETLSLVREGAPDISKPSLFPFYEFVKEKSKEPHFALHFFLNAYQTAIMLYNTLNAKTEGFISDRSEIEILSKFLELLNHEFIHPKWQELFPFYVHHLSTHPEPLKLVTLVSEIKAHAGIYSQPSIENSVRTFLDGQIRVVGRSDKSHGFYITKALSFEELLESIKSLSSKIPPPLFDQIIGDVVKPLSMIKCEINCKFLLLYCIRTLQQQSLTREEFQSFLPLMSRFLELWIVHKEALSEHDLSTKWKSFFQKYEEKLFDAKDRALMGNDLSRINPSLSYFIIQINEVKTIDPDVLAKWNQTRMLPIIGNHILSLAKSTPHKVIFKHIAAILLHTQDLSPLACKSLLEEIITKHEAPSLLDASNRQVITYLITQMIHAHHFSLLIQNKEYLEALTSYDIISALEASSTFFNESPQDEQLSIMSLLLETKTIRLLSVIFGKYPDLANQILHQWMRSHTNGHNDTYLFIQSLDFIQASLLKKADWVLPLFTQNKSLALPFITQLISSKTPSEIAPFLQGIKAHSPTIGLLIFISIEEQTVLLSTPLMPIWLEMIQGELPQLQEKLLKPLIRLFANPLLSSTPSTLLLSTLVSILVEFTKSSLYNDEALIKRALVIYLPYLSELRPSGYKQLLESIHFNLSDQPSELQTLWTREIHELLPERLALDSYILWAIGQPLSDSIIKQIKEKIGKKKINVGQFKQLSTYFNQKPNLLKSLITLGENSQIDPSLIAPLYEIVIPTQETLESNLHNLNRILNKNYADKLTLFQIAHLKKSAPLSENERALIVDCFDKIKMCSTSVKKAFFDRALQQDFFIEDPFLAPLVISKIGEDWVLDKIEELVTSIEHRFPIVTQELIKNPLYFQEGNPVIFMNKLDRFEISPSFCEFLYTLIEKTKKGFFTYSQMFPKIEAQIGRIKNHYPAEEAPPAVIKLYSHYLSTFMGQIISSKSTDLQLLLNNMPSIELLTFLPKLSPYISTFSSSFIDQYLHKLHIDGIRVSNSEQESIHKFMIKFIEISPEKESLKLLGTYSELNPEDPDLIGLYGKVFGKATSNRNEAVLTAIATILNIHFSEPSFQNKKKTFKAYFAGFISKTAPSDVVIALEFTKMFQIALELDSNSIALYLMEILAKQPADRRILAIVIQFILKIFTSHNYKFPPDKTMVIQSHFETYFNAISNEDFIEIYPHIALKEILPYSKSFLKSFFNTQGILFVRHIFDTPPCLNSLSLIKLSYRFLIEENGLNLAHVTDLTQIIQKKISELLSLSPKTPEILSTIVTSMNLYSSLTPHVSKDEQAPMLDFIRACMAVVTGVDFVFNPDRFYLISFLHVIIATERFDQINLLISAFREYYMGLGEDQFAKKELMYNFIFKNILSGFKTQFPLELIDAENCIALLQQIPHPILLEKSTDIKPFIDLLSILGESIIKNRVSAPTKPINTDRLQFLLELLHTMITPSTSIDSANHIININEVIIASGILELTNKSIIDQLYQLCLKSTQTVLNHPDLQTRISASVEIIKKEGANLKASLPIESVCDCFLHRLTLIMDNLRLTCERSMPPFTLINNHAINILQQQLLLYIDNELTRNGPRNSHTYLFPFRRIPYRHIIYVTTSLILPLIETAPTQLEKQLTLIRILMGFLYLVHSGLTNGPQEPKPLGIRPNYYEEMILLFKSLKGWVFELLRDAIISALSHPHAIEEIIDLTGAVLNVLDHEQAKSLWENAYAEILVKESAKSTPDKLIIAKVMSFIGYVSKNKAYTQEAYELQQRVVSTVPSNILSNIFSKFEFQWPWPKPSLQVI